MSSTRAALLGAQEPRVVHAPDFHFTHADDAAFLATSYGLTPDPWQFSVIEAWLGEDKRGRWTAGRCGLAVPRQNGKNGVLEIVELYKIVVLGRKILHTAHEVKTARKAFIRLCSFFENTRKFPELAALVQDIRKTNGQEAIVLTNGGSVEFVARSRGSGRGYTVDDLVCDEAQELTDEQLEALLPTISSAPSGNPQIAMTGTPPGPGSPGEVFTRMRTAGVLGKDKRLSWHEWSVEGKVNVHDRGLWAATNPSLGKRLNAHVIEDELAQMSEEGFARERLGRWASEELTSVIPASEWNAVKTEVPPADGQVAYALDMAPDRTRVSIGVCQKSETPHIEAIDPVEAGIVSVVDWLVERWPSALAVVVDAQSPAMSFVPDLQARGVKVMITGSGDMAAACGFFYDAVTEKNLTHFDQPRLNAAVAGAKKRDIGQAGGWGWDRKDPSLDLTPLVAVTLALFGAMKAKPKKLRSHAAVFR